MKRLDPSQYAAVLPLFKSLDFNLVIRSMVEGNTPAWIFADRPAAPRLGLMWDCDEMLFVAGEGQDIAALAAMRNVLHNQILPEAHTRAIPELALVSTPAWKDQLPLLLDGLNPRLARYLCYRLAAGARPPALQPPQGFALQRIDSALLDSALDHIRDLRGWVDSFWHTPQDFLRSGFGFCAIQGETIAAWCLTVFAAGSARELGLITLPEYRGLGLATLTAAACVEHGLSQNLAVRWTCWAENAASARVAEKVGFTRDREYPAFCFQTGLEP